MVRRPAQPKSEFAARVQMYRRMHGLSTAELAEQMHGFGFDWWTEHTVVAMENDRGSISFYELAALTQVFAVQPSDLVPAWPQMFFSRGEG